MILTAETSPHEKNSAIYNLSQYITFRFDWYGQIYPPAKLQINKILFTNIIYAEKYIMATFSLWTNYEL
jgi:hypothetical protein